MGKRPIKFRAWHKGEAFMIDWDLIVDDGILAYFASGDYELMQYTGLKDKDGHEIYEGDVIDSGGKRGSDGSAILYAVKWSDEAMGFDLQQLGRYCMTGGIDAKKVVVIGNIYENPELLNP